MDFRLILKVAITAVTIVAISEIGKRSSIIAALLAALPLTSVLAFIWLYIDNRDNDSVAKLSMDIFWLVIPSLAFFPLFSFLLRQQYSFVLSLLAAGGVTVGLYLLFFTLLRRLGAI